MKKCFFLALGASVCAIASTAVCLGLKATKARKGSGSFPSETEVNSGEGNGKEEGDCVCGCTGCEDIVRDCEDKRKDMKCKTCGRCC